MIRLARLWPHFRRAEVRLLPESLGVACFGVQILRSYCFIPLFASFCATIHCTPTAQSNIGLQSLKVLRSRALIPLLRCTFSAHCNHAAAAKLSRGEAPALFGQTASDGSQVSSRIDADPLSSHGRHKAEGFGALPVAGRGPPNPTESLTLWETMAGISLENV